MNRIAGCVGVLALLLSACTTGVRNSIPPPAEQPPDGQWDFDFDIRTPELDPSGDFGNGQDGPLDVATDTVVNDCFEVVTASGATVDAAALTGVSPGRLLIVWQTQDVFAVSGPSAPVDDAGRAGSWELVRAEAVSGDTAMVDPPLMGMYDTASGATAQVCSVPEYTDVLVQSGASILPLDFDGFTGGLVAFFATGTLTVDGGIDVTGAGFRGGILRQNTDTPDVVVEDTTGGDGGGKGEGLDGLSHRLEGRGAMANAGGGGNGHNAGGGGGGSGGAGGLGGKQAESHGDIAETAGREGGMIALGPKALTLGGGGGAGHQDDDQGGFGGPGAGAVFLAVRGLAGTGVIAANGLRGADSSFAGNGDGAGGGGAGGTLRIRTADVTFTGTLEALGAAGGDSIEDGTHGPGGGGAGGRAIFQGLSLMPSLLGGAAGINASNSDPWGATAGGEGTLTVQ